MYIATRIREEYLHWHDKKIIISAPTGSGKTTFILKKLVPFYHEQGKKLLILCNRKILELQYGYAIAECLSDFREEENVQIVTYQKMAAELREGGNLLEEKYAEFDGVCLDECHYFVSDAEFNSFGTAAVWNAIKKIFWTKQMIFMSATLQEIEPFITAFITEIKENVPERIQPKPSYTEIKVYPMNSNYNYVLPIFVPNIETLCEKLRTSEGKSMIFVNDGELAEKIKKNLINLGEDTRQIAVLSAEKMQTGKMDEIIEAMALGHRLLPRILITTSVLDTGISLHDSAIKNICIIGEEKTSFLQMLGRIRMKNVINEKLNLYLVDRGLQYYRRRDNELRKKIEILDRYEKNFGENKIQNEILGKINEETQEADLLRKVTYWSPNWEINVHCTWLGKSVIQKNSFAIAKIRQQYLCIRRLHVALAQDVYGVAKEQVSWLGIPWESVKIEESVDVEKNKKMELKNFLLSKDFPMDKTEFQEMRDVVAKKYFGILYADIILRARPISKEKMGLICTDLGLVLETEKREKSYVYIIREKENK